MIISNLRCVIELKNAAFWGLHFLYIDLLLEFYIDFNLYIVSLLYQNSSNCWEGICVGRIRRQEKISISANCLSVIRIMPISPSGGKIRFTRLICTSAFSALGQWRTYIENWNIVKPSCSSCFRKRAYSLRAFFVSVGKSKNTNTHMIRYSLKRALLTIPDKWFCAPRLWNTSAHS